MGINSINYQLSYQRRLPDSDTKAVPQDSMTVHERLGISPDVQLKENGLSKDEINRMKFFGPAHREGIDWKEIENSLINTETKEVIRVGKEIQGRIVFEPSMIDAGFMDRLLVMNQSYRDNIEKVFSGDEKVQYLQQLDELFEKTKETLKGRFTDVFASFFGDGFDKEKFSANVEQLMQQKQQALQKLTKQHKDEWYGYRTLSFEKTDFAGLLANQSLSNEGSTAIEMMSYQEMSILAIGIQEVNKDIHNGMIHTPLASPEEVAAYLGQAKLKGNLIMKHSNLSESVREAFSQTLSSKIDAEIEAIIQQRKEKYKEIGIPDPQPVHLEKVRKAIADIDDLADVEPSQFRTLYMKSLDKLGPYNDPFNRQYLVHDWNSFIDKLSLGKDHPYTLPAGKGTLINWLV